MTRKELVDALTANFAEDEEVTFVYNDDQGEVRETKVEIREHEQETYKGHWEYKGVLVGDYADIRKMYKTGIDMRGERCSYSDLHVHVKWVRDGGPFKDKRRVVYVG